MRIVLLPYRFTLFSNVSSEFPCLCLFYYLIDLHYSQTGLPIRFRVKTFYYLIDLHYSQTVCGSTYKIIQFYYLIDLHYSQTPNFLNENVSGFYYLIDLHYSQTSNLKLGIKCTHYTMHGKSIRLFYNICIMIVNKIHTNHYQSQQVFRIQKLLSVLSFQC